MLASLSRLFRSRSVSSPPRFRNDLGHLVHLSLRTSPRTELFTVLASASKSCLSTAREERFRAQLTLFLANFLALLSFEFLNNSMHLLSYGANPHTSRTISRQNLVRLLRWPRMREMRGFGVWGVTLWPALRPTATAISINIIYFKCDASKHTAGLLFDLFRHCRVCGRVLMSVVRILSAAGPRLKPWGVGIYVLPRFVRLQA